MLLQISEVNCAPLSEVTEACLPNLTIHSEKRTPTQHLVEADGTRMVSALRVGLSMIVKRCVSLNQMWEEARPGSHGCVKITCQKPRWAELLPAHEQ
jgi:hypothetical protein